MVFTILPKTPLRSVKDNGRFGDLKNYYYIHIENEGGFSSSIKFLFYKHTGSGERPDKLPTRKAASQVL